MPKRSRKNEEDENALAARIVRAATDEDGKREKNAAAVELGRRGGLKGGPAKAAKLSAKKRKAIARRRRRPCAGARRRASRRAPAPHVANSLYVMVRVGPRQLCTKSQPSRVKATFWV